MRAAFSPAKTRTMQPSAGTEASRDRRGAHKAGDAAACSGVTRAPYAAVEFKSAACRFSAATWAQSFAVFPLPRRNASISSPAM